MATTTVQQSNTLAFPQAPKSKKNDSVNRTDQYATLRMQLIQQLQTSLELERILSFFYDTIDESISLGSLSYSNSRIESSIDFGKKSKHSCEYQLKNEMTPIGKIKFTRSRRFTEAEFELIESLLACLICPIRNALLYKEAVQTSLEDPLTGAGNRLALENTLEREVRLALRHKQPLSVIVVDIDHFKNVNDDHGHSAGDSVLQNVASRLADCSRDTDSAFRAFRYGGEEFVLLLNNTNKKGSLVVGERIRSAIEKMHSVYEDKKINVTVSVGVASLLLDDNMSRLFQRADKALYKAKHRGRNNVISACEIDLEPKDLMIS